MGYAAKPVTKINRLVGDYPPLFQVGFLCGSATITAQIRQALGIDPGVIQGTNSDGSPAPLYVLTILDGALGVAIAPAGSVPGCAPITDPDSGLSYFPIVVDGVIGAQQIL